MYCSVKLSAYSYTEHTPVFLMWLDYSTLLKTKKLFSVRLLKWLLNILRHLLLAYSAFSFFLLHSVVYKSSLQSEGSTAASTVTQSLIQSLGQSSETVCMVSTKGEENPQTDDYN